MLSCATSPCWVSWQQCEFLWYLLRRFSVQKEWSLDSILHNIVNYHECNFRCMMFAANTLSCLCVDSLTPSQGAELKPKEAKEQEQKFIWLQLACLGTTMNWHTMHQALVLVCSGSYRRWTKYSNPFYPVQPPRPQSSVSM